ncbi:MAG: Serine/threonine protein kinase [Candidatus Ozemobacter sibiricus]|uniref:Serine/threonine protein kinase n=1 Tax=Candidatus Ozemobacter sibiricus TaxID=2268124 RepID=A0A367ZUQ5_9BACT|nr:MAG: Serine/threonine protein kinase [Candidatus Ozemobacter sibiricus]
MNGTVELRVLDGERRGQVLSFASPAVVLFGRVPDATLCIVEDPFVSRHHFLLEISPPFCRLTDLGSRNGVFVNDTLYGGRASGARKNAWPLPPSSVFLGDGDQIVVGKNRLQVFIAAASTPGFQPLRRIREALRRGPSGLAVATPRMGELGAGAQVGRYQVEEVIGYGWMGATYRATDGVTGGRVVLKTLVPNIVFDEGAAARFLALAQPLTGLVHPRIVRQLDVWRSGNIFLAAQEYHEGVNLKEFLAQRGGRLALEEALPLMNDILDALVWAEAEGCLKAQGTAVGESASRERLWHRNLKPQNILVSGEGGARRALIVDLGLFSGLERAGLIQMILAGLYAEAAPYWPRERVTFYGQTIGPSEVFSVAALLYECLTGARPREGFAAWPAEARQAGRPIGLAEVMRVMAEHPPVPIRERRPDLPPVVAEVFDRALAEPMVMRGQEDPAEVLARARFPDLAALRRAWQSACAAAGWPIR